MTNIVDFLHSENCTAAVAAALKVAVNGDRVLFFPPGEYHFYMDGCFQRHCFFSNNEDSLKNIAILLDGVDDFTISGVGAHLMFHGRISPLCAFNCRNLTVSGIKVDFEDSFVSDADLICRENGVAWFKLPGKHQVCNGRIVFTGDIYDNYNGRLPFYPYDRTRSELIYDQRIITVENQNILERDGLVGVPDLFENCPTDAFVIKHENRLCPAMVFDNCDDLRVSDVTLHHAAGMGCLIQKSDSCTVDGLVIAPSSRRTSVSDDALHITDCRGKLRILNCKLSGTLDDSINVHGVFRKLKSRIPGGKMFYLEAGHYQQQGIFNIHPGDTLELRHRSNGKPYGRLKINAVSPCNKAFSIIKIDENELPADFVQGDPGWILETQADLEVINTECRPLNGRGVLASGLKNVRIAGCTIHSSGAGVFISGDYSFWYESGPVENVLIENNFFDNCNYKITAATQEPVAVFPELDELADDFYYHGRIEVRNNHFRSAPRPLVSMKSVKSAVVVGNSWEADDRYRFIPKTIPGYHFATADSPRAAFLHCKEVDSDWKD